MLFADWLLSIYIAPPHQMPLADWFNLLPSGLSEEIRVLKVIVEEKETRLLLLKDRADERDRLAGVHIGAFWGREEGRDEMDVDQRLTPWGVYCGFFGRKRGGMKD